MCRSANPLSRLLLLLALAGLVSAAAATPAAKRRYDLAAGNAGTTLRQFVEQSGEQVLYVVPRVRDVTTNAVKGEFTAREVLDLMLKNTVLVVVEDTKTGALMINRGAEPKPAEPPGANPQNEPQKNTMITTNHRKNPLAWLGALFALTLGQSTTAQTVDANASPAPITPTKGEVIELSPFIVTADEDEGYQASSTLAGSRMATSLRDTAASVSVLTAELLADIGAISLDEAVAFATNVELEHDQINNDNATFENFNTYRIRGQAANIGRNYFRWYVPSDTFNVERIEEARGPNSILFGIASAGGMISSQTKQANTNRDFQNVSLVTGSYNMYRATLDVNQASDNKKFGVRLNAVYSDAKGFKHHAFDESERIHLAVKYNLTPNTIIRAEYERGNTFTNRTNNQMLGDNVQRWVAAGSPVMVVTATNNALGVTRLGTGAGAGMVTPNEVSPGVFEFIDLRGQGITQGLGGGLLAEPFYDPRNFRASSGGPDQTQASESETYSAFIDHRLFKNTHVQLAYNHQEYVFDGWQARLNANLNADPNKFLRDGVTPNPYAGKYYFEGQWTRYYREGDSDNLRFSISQELLLGKWGEYRLAGLAEREESRAQRGVVGGAEHWFDETTGRGAFNNNPSASGNRVIRRHYIDINDQSTWFHGFTNPATSGLFTGVTDPNNPNRTLGSVLLGGASQYDDPTEQDTYLLSGQGYYFKRKLVVAGGYRWDTLYQHEGLRGKTDSVGRFILPGPDDPVTNRTSNSKTRTYGVVYHVLPWLSLRYNSSNSYELPDANQRIMPEPGPNGEFIGYRQGDSAQGEGEDYGFDLSLLDGRVHVRATRYSTNRVRFQRNGFSGFDSPMTLSTRVLTALEDAGKITTAEHDLHRIDINGSTGDMVSDGDELSITTNVTKNWRLTANYSTTTSVSDNLAPEIKRWAEIEIPYYQKFDQNITVASTGQTIGFEIADWLDSLNNVKALEGVASLGTRKHKLSFVSRYSFRDGALKGLSVGGSATHQSKNIVGIRTDGNLVYGNSITTLGASLNYGIRQVPGLKFLKNLNIQLNVYNLLDTRDPMIIRYLNNNADSLQVIRMAARAPRTWRLSANMSF